MKEYCDTNEKVIDRMIDVIDVVYPPLYALSILEASAGNGAIIKRLPRDGVDGYGYVSFCEINQKKASAVHEETGATFLDWDFLKLSEYLKFDRVIAVPPFENIQVAILHTYKAYKHLKEYGKMAILLPVEALSNSEFFKWVISLHAKIEFLKECACDYQCETFILEIVKQN